MLTEADKSCLSLEDLSIRDFMLSSAISNLSISCSREFADAKNEVKFQRMLLSHSSSLLLFHFPLYLAIENSSLFMGTVKQKFGGFFSDLSYSWEINSVYSSSPGKGCSNAVMFLLCFDWTVSYRFFTEAVNSLLSIESAES